MQETARAAHGRAAHGRGEVAEAEMRWHDAARHYANAARLAPGFDTLFKAREYAWRAGSLDAAHRYGADLVALARNEGTQEQRATALNEHAITFQAQGRYAEAEGLSREALEIGRATLGAGHPAYAIRLGNLAGVVQAQGRYAEAEALYREALEIGRATLGERHPAYATRLGNLGWLLGQTGRVAEGRDMLERALAIFRAALPPDHPHIAGTQRRLAALAGDRAHPARHRRDTDRIPTCHSAPSGHSPAPGGDPLSCPRTPHPVEAGASSAARTSSNGQAEKNPPSQGGDAQGVR